MFCGDTEWKFFMLSFNKGVVSVSTLAHLQQNLSPSPDVNHRFVMKQPESHQEESKTRHFEVNVINEKKESTKTIINVTYTKPS